MNGGNHNDVAATSAIAATGSSTRNVFLAAEGEATIPAVTSLNCDSNFIYKHEKSR
jgi:hypothetical protein